MFGHMNAVYPSPLQLHQLFNMEYDANVKRGQFIETSIQIRETFGFAQPPEVLQAVHTYAGHLYGSMFLDLFGGKGWLDLQIMEYLCKVNLECSKIHPFLLVDNLLAVQFFTVKQQLLSRFVNFVKKLVNSNSPGVCISANMVSRCARSTTRRNLL